MPQILCDRPVYSASVNDSCKLMLLLFSFLKYHSKYVSVEVIVTQQGGKEEKFLKMLSA